MSLREQKIIVTGKGPVVMCCSVALCLNLLSLLGCGRSRDEDHRQQAHEYVEQGNIGAAIVQLEKIQEPKSDDFNLRGELLLQLGRPRYNDAEAAFHAALKLDNRNVRALHGLALVAVLQKQFKRGEELSRKVLWLQPNSFHTQNLLAGALIYQEKYEEGEGLLLDLEREPTIAGMAKANLGELYLRQKKLNLAEAKLKEAISHPPDNFDRHRLLGDVYRLQGKGVAALMEYRKAFELLQESPWADSALLEGIRKRIRELES